MPPQSNEAVLKAENVALKAELAAITAKRVTLDKAYATLQQKYEEQSSALQEDEEIKPFLSHSQLSDDELPFPSSSSSSSSSTAALLQPPPKKQKTSASSSSSPTSSTYTSTNPHKYVNVRVGVGVLLKKSSGKVVAGIRKGSHGAGKLALPGGHLEMYESWQECGAREVMEEVGVSCGVEGSDLNFLRVTNDPMETEGKHYITIFLCGTIPSNSELLNLEPNKCEGWNEYTYDELVQSGRLFGPLEELINRGGQSVRDWINS
jgi:8-oxo-dGTP diphosphatase